jgi:hypothetical protein
MQQNVCNGTNFLPLVQVMRGTRHHGESYVLGILVRALAAQATRASLGDHGFGYRS